MSRDLDFEEFDEDWVNAAPLIEPVEPWADDVVAGVSSDGIPWVGVRSPGGGVVKTPGPGNWKWTNNTDQIRTFTDIPGWNRAALVSPGNSLTVEAPEFVARIDTVDGDGTRRTVIIGWDSPAVRRAVANGT